MVYMLVTYYIVSVLSLALLEINRSLAFFIIVVVIYNL